MAYENFNSYTEVDPSSRLTINSSTQYTARFNRNEDMHLYKDYGAGAFGNFSHYVTAQSPSSINLYDAAYFWTVANTVDDLRDIKNNSGDFLSIAYYRDYDGRSIMLRVSNAGVTSRDDYSSFSYSTNYYFTITRNSTTITCYIYSDSERNTLVDTLSVTCPSTSFRYIFAANTDNTGLSRLSQEIVVSNLDLRRTYCSAQII